MGRRLFRRPQLGVGVGTLMAAMGLSWHPCAGAVQVRCHPHGVPERSQLPFKVTPKCALMKVPATRTK